MEWGKREGVVVVVMMMISRFYFNEEWISLMITYKQISSVRVYHHSHHQLHQSQYVPIGIHDPLIFPPSPPNGNNNRAIYSIAKA